MLKIIISLVLLYPLTSVAQPADVTLRQDITLCCTHRQTDRQPQLHFQTLPFVVQTFLTIKGRTY